MPTVLLHLNSREFFDQYRKDFPHILTLDRDEVNPWSVEMEINFQGSWINAVFDGKAHWAFQNEIDLKLFRVTYGV
jgi:hypothetical protein